MLPSQFLQFATPYHLLPSLTILYLLHMIFWPLREAKHRHGASDAEPSWTSTLFPMSANGRCGLPRFASFCELLGPQFQFPLCVARSTRLCPRRPTSNAQRHHFFEFLSFILIFHHRSAQRFARNKNKNKFRSANSRQAGLLPIVVGPHSGAFDLVPYDAPEELELGRHQFSVWKNLRFSKRWET